MPTPPSRSLSLSTTGATAGAPPRARLSRIAVLTAGATLMGAAAACDSTKTTADAGTGGQTMSGAGGAGGNATGGTSGAPDAGTGGSGARDAGDEAPVAIYAAAVARLPRNLG